jgi:hypothetical protein
LLGSGGTLPASGEGFEGLEEVLGLKEKLEQREKMINDLNMSWEERLRETQRLQQERENTLQSMGVAVKLSKGMPHLVNLNEDPIMSECLVYYLAPGITRIGRPDAETTQNIRLNGLSIAKEHAIVENAEGVVTIASVSNAPVFINGQLITAPTSLPHSARVILGTNHIFRYHSGVANEKQEEQRSPEGGVIDWNFALKELFTAQNKVLFKEDDEEKEKERELAEKLKQLNDEIEKQRFESHQVMEQQRREYEQKLQEMEKLVEQRDVKHMKEQARLAFEAQQLELGARDKILQEAYEKQRATYMVSSIQRWQEKKRRLQLQDQLLRMMITINEANAISEALHKNVSFSPKLSLGDYNSIFHDSDEHQMKKTEMTVEMTNSSTGNSGLLTYNKFMEKLFALRERYEAFLENGTEVTPPGEAEDPFSIPKEDRLLGIAQVYLKSLSYLLSVDRDSALVDTTGLQIGTIKVVVDPKNGGGKESIGELSGQALEFSIKIESAEVNDVDISPFDSVHCKFNLWDRFSETTPRWVKEGLHFAFFWISYMIFPPAPVTPLVDVSLTLRKT